MPLIIHGYNGSVTKSQPAKAAISARSATSAAEIMEHGRLKWLNHLCNRSFKGNVLKLSARLSSATSTASGSDFRTLSMLTAENQNE